jgi:hypothetical protein
MTYLYRVQTQVGMRYTWLCQACGSGGPFERLDAVVREAARGHRTICWAQMPVPSGFKGILSEGVK